MSFTISDLIGHREIGATSVVSGAHRASAEKGGDRQRLQWWRHRADEEPHLAASSEDLLART